MNLEKHKIALSRAATVRSVESLLDLPFSILCLDHGPPLKDDPKAALRELLARPAAG
jgi:hypothetical protein